MKKTKPSDLFDVDPNEDVARVSTPFFDTPSKPTHTTEYVEESKKNQHDWEDEFEKRFNKGFYYSFENDDGVEDLKDFISTRFVSKEELKSKIAQLRQWLNEDRIKDADRFVTNEDIELWLLE